MSDQQHTPPSGTVIAPDPRVTQQAEPDPRDMLDRARTARERDTIKEPTGDAEHDPAGAMRDAAAGRALDDGQTVDALEWFLGEDEGEFTKTLRLNMGGPVDEDGKALSLENSPIWIEWVIRPVDLDEVKAIRRRSQAGSNRRQRRASASSGQIDDMKFNLGVVVAGTVSPDIAEAASSKGIADPTAALEMRFSRKGGLIGQISGQILDLSGYNEDDVQEAAEEGSQEVRAAGN
jgi:hypothetical protein